MSSTGHSQQQLEKAALFLDSIIENIPNMIFLKDAKELRFVRFNKAGEKLLGIPREEMIGKNDYDFFPKDQADFFTEKDRAVLAGDGIVDIPEEPIKTAKQGVRWLHTRKVPIKDEMGNPLYLLGISEDITERKEAEEALRKLTAELEERVQERTKALEESNRALRRSNAELDEFAYTASHDLRTPLRAMNSFAELLMKHYADNLDELGQDYLKRIQRSSSQMSKMIDSLLTYSRITSPTGATEPVDLDNLLKSITHLLGFDLKQNQVTLVVQNDLPTVQGNPVKISKLFTNLLDNAIKYTAENGANTPHIAIGYEELDEAYQFSIKDNGIGVHPEDQERIFNLFERGQDMEYCPGNGVGLSIVKRIVEEQGGKIWVDSENGNGATFYFTFLKQPEALDDSADK